MISRTITLVLSVLFSSMSFASDFMTKINWVGDKYDAYAIEVVSEDEKSSLLQLYTKLKVRESQIPFEEGMAYRKNFINNSKEFQLECSVLDYLKTTKFKSISCHIVVSRLQAYSYDVFFYEYSPRMLQVGFKDKYAKEILDVLDNDGTIQIALSNKFEVSGGSSTFIFAISE